MSHIFAANSADKVAYLIIGSGRLALHLQAYLNTLGIHYSSWDRAQDPHLIKTKIHAATHVLLAISDSAIEGFYYKHLAGLDKKVVHFSGALHFEDIPCAHPLMTFGPELYSGDFYKQIYFAVTGAENLEALLPGFKNPHFVLSAEQKSFYHASCVMSGNFIAILASQFIDNLQHLQAPAAAGDLYLKTSLENALKLKWQSVTGPLVRKDQGTINRNLEALKQMPEWQNVYRAFQQIFDKKSEAP